MKNHSIIQRTILRTILFLAALVPSLLGGGSIMAQSTPADGIYYIASEYDSENAETTQYSPSGSTANHFYWVPAKDAVLGNKEDAYYKYNTYGYDKPYLTTYRTNRDLNSIWILQKTGNYFYIIHALSGKYLVYSVQNPSTPTRRVVHLSTQTNPDVDSTKFTITKDASGNVLINPKLKSSGDKYLNPANHNINQYNATSDKNNSGGIIGVWKEGTGLSIWHLEDASTDNNLKPVISDVDPSTNTFTITSPAAAFSTIHYTTDGTTTPDASTETTVASGGSISITGNWNVQAIGVFGSFVTPIAGPKPLSQAPCATPVISFDNTTSTVTITCATENSTIYYTTNGDTPTVGDSEYNAPFSITSLTTVKAIATHATLATSEVGSLTIDNVATPVITPLTDGTVEITCATTGATIHYEMGTSTPSDPTTSSTEYTGPIEGAAGKVIKAFAVKEGYFNSAVATSATIVFTCATPVIRKTDVTHFTITCSFPTSDVTIHYTTDGSTPSVSSSSVASGRTVSIEGSLPMTVKAIAVATNYNNSDVASKLIIDNLEQDDEDNYYIIATESDFDQFISMVNSTDAGANYKITADITVPSGSDPITEPFTGVLKGVAKADGTLPVISGLDHALINTLDGGTVKNLVLDNVTISGGTNVGAICNEATGDSRIYNCGVLATNSTVTTDDDGYTKITSCSSTVGGSNYVGGLVGLLDVTSRVINCFSYANITSGAEVGGIVGHNNVATTSNNLKTMVMNCMFYGDIDTNNCTSKAPIYNGEIITNDGDANGVNNYNYFWSGATYVQDRRIDVYQCALGAETRFLQRFEFFRPVLNSNRALAAWWVNSTSPDTSEIMKWVMEPDNIGTSTPYPILKKWGKYPSVVNYTPGETDYDYANRNKGRKLGTLTVTIEMGTNSPYAAPSDASITNSDTILTITDKDFEHFNFNYGKVQLPYYNEVGTKNYTGNRVVTGWKITSITGGTKGSYSTGDDVTNTDGELTATPYNFADRTTWAKDFYGTGGSNRVFNQGAYWDVPEGVTAITIQPYWGKAVYLSDAYWDVVYQNGTEGGTGTGSTRDAMTTAANVPNVGGGVRYENGVSTFNGQVVYTSMGNAITSSGTGMALFQGVTGSPSSQTVYDYAVVLVGNYHHNGSIESGEGKPYTVTSVDLDGDNEPDYSLMLRFNARTGFHPARYDFLNMIGLGMAQKSTGGTGTYNFAIIQPKYWFEVTNTALFRVTQFEYSPGTRSKKPIILQGGVVEQWVTQQQDAGDRVSYFHVGGNVWFKEFHRGSHQDNKEKSTPHPPLSVTGGDYDEFYLTGLYQSQATTYDDNAECYIDGGRFGIVAGAGMEGIGTTEGKGNITWIIDHADINEFYGGGINFAKPVFGNIHTIIRNSYVYQFCGGPKFGNMGSGRTVTTVADNCHFVLFFGAGYGGNSYNRYAPANRNNVINLPGPGKLGSSNAIVNLNSWNAWVDAEYKQTYNATYEGVSTQINYQFIPHSSNVDNVARLWVEFVGFSLATTNNVTSTLTNCTIDSNFYGGGSLGKVDGTVSSVLDSCIVKGNVFGAGYSATKPIVAVMNRTGFLTEPHYDEQSGTFLDHVFPDTVHYHWEEAAGLVNSTQTAINTGTKTLYTTEDLDALGVVNTATLTIKGNSEIGTILQNGSLKPNTGNVYGGGDQSAVSGSTTVILQQGATVLGNVYGGGNEGAVGGNSEVMIQDQ